jgi:hypothetical protein
MTRLGDDFALMALADGFVKKVSCSVLVRIELAVLVTSSKVWGFFTAPLAFKSVFCKVRAALASRLSMNRTIAASMNVSLVCASRS